MLPSQWSLKPKHFPWSLFCPNWLLHAEFWELAHILWVTLSQSCEKADVRPVRAEVLAHCYTSCATAICMQGLNCHLMFSAGKGWVCDRDGDSGFNVCVAVTLNITPTTHIKQVGILVIVIGISLSSQMPLHYCSFCILHAVTQHVSLQHSLLQYSFTPCGSVDLSLLSEGHNSTFMDCLSQVKLGLYMKQTVPK